MSGDPGPFPPPGFGRFLAGEAVSGLGTYVTLLAVQTLVVLELSGGAAEVGLVNAARWLPYLVVGLVVGALVDRVRRRPVMVVSDLLSAALLLVVPISWALGALTLPVVLLVMVGYGTATLVNGAASMSFVPRLVPRAHLQRAHARLDGADAVAQTAGPALGGLLVRVVGAPLAVLLDAATYLFSAATVATVPVVEPAAVGRGDRDDGGARPRLRREIAEGVRWVYGPSGLARLALATHVWFAANAVLAAVLAPYALNRLGLSAAVFGLTTAAAGVGGVAGAVLSTALGRRLGTGGAIIAAHAVTTVGVAAMASAALGSGVLAAGLLLGLGQLLHGAAIGLSNSHEMSYRQALTPDALQGRTNTTMRSFNRAVIVVVSPLAGLLADRLGLTTALVVATVVFAAVVVMLLASPFRRARVAVE